MKIITIKEKDYKLEYSFAAAEYKDLVKRVFLLLTGANMLEDIDNENQNETLVLLSNLGSLVADTSSDCRLMFYAGLMENHPEITEDEAYELMKQYMRDNKLSFHKLFAELMGCMGDDGFFDLTGLTERVAMLNNEIVKVTKAAKTPKRPQDHKKKSTSTK